MMEHGVELIAQGGVDVGDVAVECRAQPVSSRRQQAGHRLAEPRFQRFTEAQLAVEEGCQLGRRRSPACWPKKRPSSTDSRRGRRCCGACAVGAAIVASSPMVCRSRPSWRRVPDQRGSGGQAFWGMLATMRKLVVSSSICSQGRR